MRRLFEGTRNCFSRKLLFGIEVVIETAVGKTRLLHDVSDADILHTMQSEHPRCSFEYELPILFGLFAGQSHVIAFMPKIGHLTMMTIIIVNVNINDGQHHYWSDFMSGSLQGKVAVITGGGEGIGLASAKRLIREGASVFIVGRRQTILDAAVAEIGGDVVALRADVSRPADLDRVYEAVRASKGKIDILVANAGVQTREPLGSITEEAIDYQLAINFKGVIFTVQQALPLLTNGASIILTSSAAAVKGIPQRTVYSATKAAIRSFARTWAHELKGRFIRVNVFSPGPILTPLLEQTFADPKVKEAYMTNVVGAVPLGRAGEAEEMGEVVAFLASEAASYINGADIQADGGLAQV
jgi:NAD(P)-dependent dehydrogenase (short-subunit alcohol dehydrogenase family)